MLRGVGGTIVAAVAVLGARHAARRARLALTPPLAPPLWQGPKRTSALAAPIMLLTGHSDQVFSIKFSPAGDVVASGSHDKTVLLWRTYGEECENFLVLRGHKNAVLDLHWSPDGEQIITCSPDRTVRSWDALTGEQLLRLSGHTDIVNSCCPLRRGPPLVVSGSDDGTAKVSEAGGGGSAPRHTHCWGWGLARIQTPS